jgi:hypothetical protein
MRWTRIGNGTEKIRNKKKAESVKEGRRREEEKVRIKKEMKSKKRRQGRVERGAGQ